MTASDLIEATLRLIGAIASGETPTAAEEADALVVLNDMLESWSTNNLTIYRPVREEFTLVAGQAVHTMGSAGDFNTTRPTEIKAAGIMDSDNEIPMDIINLQQWASINLKDTQSTLPMYLYAEGAYPLERINLWPVPSAANTLVIYSLKPLTSLAASDTILLPPGYTRAMRYNLAQELAPEYGKSLDLRIEKIATDSLADIKRRNTKPVYLRSDVVGLTSGKGHFNWHTGE